DGGTRAAAQLRPDAGAQARDGGVLGAGLRGRVAAGPDGGHGDQPAQPVRGVRLQGGAVPRGGGAIRRVGERCGGARDGGGGDGAGCGGGDAAGQRRFVYVAGEPWWLHGRAVGDGGDAVVAGGA